MEASSRSHTKAFNFVFYCTIALCGQNSRAAEPKNRRYDLILFCAMFPFSCTSVIKSRSEAHTCVPVGNARHANCYTAFTFRASRAETRSHTRTYSQWVWVWLRGRFGPSMPHCSDLCHPQTFIYLVLLRFVNIFLSKQCTGTGSLTKKHKGTYRRIEAMQNCPGPRLLSSPSQLGAAPLRRSDHISPTGELFIYLFNFIISAEWRYDWRWSNIPTQVDTACPSVCADKGATHTSEHGSVFRLIGAPRAPWSLYLTLSKDTDYSQHVRTDTCAYKHS